MENSITKLTEEDKNILKDYLKYLESHDPELVFLGYKLFSNSKYGKLLENNYLYMKLLDDSYLANSIAMNKIHFPKNINTNLNNLFTWRSVNMATLCIRGLLHLNANNYYDIKILTEMSI